MDKREKLRQEWEVEIRRRQQNITPADYPEGLHYVRPDGLPRITSQARFWLGIVLVAIGVSVFRFTFPGVAIVAAIVIVAGLIVIVTTMR